MKKTNKILLLAVIAILGYSSTAYAIRSRKDYFLKPQVGIWFGPITPVYTTEEHLDAAIGAGIFVRYNTPWRLLKIGLDTSYHKFESDGVNELTTIPVYGNLIYLLPLNWPVKIQLKAGAGSGYVHMMPDDSSQWDPVFMAGAEISFPAGRLINIGLRIDYIHFYEGYADNYKEGGHIVNAGLSLYFNINL
jgi:hypothetical protein